MKTYVLNSFGSDWTYQAKSKAEATREFLDQMGLDTMKDYAHYCKVCGVPSKLDFKEIVKK